LTAIGTTAGATSSTEEGATSDEEASSAAESADDKPRSKADLKAERERQRAELELLMMDESEHAAKVRGLLYQAWTLFRALTQARCIAFEATFCLQHFDMKEVVRAEKAAGKSGKLSRRSKMKQALAKKAAEDTFQLDVNDPRFAAVYESALFAIDPSNPQYDEGGGGYYRMTLGLQSLNG